MPIVRGEGPKNAKVVLVGEAPGDQEMKEGRPFVGGAGRVLDGMLTEAGLRREECYITNILTEQPASSAATSEARNFFGAVYEDRGRKKPSDRLLSEVDRLHEELLEVRPNIVVALGNEALRWVAGKSGITDWRGSIVSGREDKPQLASLKVMGTYHPAAILRQWSNRPVSVFDYRRALEQSKFPEIRRMERVHHVVSRVEELEQAVARMIEAQAPVAFDIETESRQVSVLSLASSPDRCVTVPIWWGPAGSLWSVEQEETVWRTIGRLFASVPMVGQNVHYDLSYLELYDVKCKTLWMDTMVGFHILYPELPKALDFMGSIYTDVPYWKGMRKAEDMDTFFRYNALDAMVTIECAKEIEKELREG